MYAHTESFPRYRSLAWRVLRDRSINDDSSGRDEIGFIELGYTEIYRYLRANLRTSLKLHSTCRNHTPIVLRNEIDSCGLPKTVCERSV